MIMTGNVSQHHSYHMVNTKQLLMMQAEQKRFPCLTFDLCVLAVLLRLALDNGGWLGDDGCAKGACRDLLQDVDSLDSRLRGAGAHWGGHGVGHWLDGLR